MNRTQLLRRLTAAACITLCAGLRAQPAPLPEDFPVLVENAPDSSAGFGMLQKKMAPLPEGAEAVRVIIRNGDWNHHYGMNDVFLPVEWIKGGEEESSVLISHTRTQEGTVRTVEERKGGGYHMDFNVEEVDYVVDTMDLAKELRTLFDLLASEDEDKKWEKQRVEQQYGEIMLYATRLYQLGYTDQANQLAAYLFEKNSKRSTVLRTLSTLADHRYMDALNKLETGKDPAAFVAEVKQILEQSRAFWEVAPKVQEKLPPWEAGLAMGADELPPTAETALNAAQKALYQKLVSDPEQLAILTDILEGQNWYLLPNSLLVQRMGYHSDEDSPVLEESLALLKKSRRDLLNLAVVMMEDPRLLPYRDAYGEDRIEYNDWEELPSLPEPNTVGDFALRLLAGLAPGDESWEKDEPEDTRMMILNYRDITGEMDRVALSKFYLERRTNYRFPMEAVYTLLSEGTETERKQLVEELIVEPDTMHQALGILLDYHRFQEEEANEGLKKILAYMKTVNPDEAWSFGGKEGLERNIAKVETLLGIAPEVEEEEEPPAFAEALDSWLAAGEQNNPEAVQVIIRSGQEMNPKEVEGMLAARMENASLEKGESILELYAMVVRSGGLAEMGDMMGRDFPEQMEYYVNREAVDSEEDSAEVEIDFSNLGWSKDAWLPVLRADSSYEQKVLAQMLAFRILSPVIFETASYETLQDIHLISNGINSPGFRKPVDWAIALLENPEDESWMEELPNREKVPEERITEMTAVLSGTDVAAAQKLMREADFNEQLMVHDLCMQKAVAENEALWKAQIPLRNTVAQLYSTLEGTDPVVGASAVGSELSFDDIKQMISRIQAEAKTGKNGLFAIQMLPYQRGISVYHSQDYDTRAYLEEKGIRIYGINNEHRVNGEFEIDAPLTLTAPADGKKKELSILDLVEASEDQQLETLSASVYEWLTSPLPPQRSWGQLMVVYDGREQPEDEETSE